MVRLSRFTRKPGPATFARTALLLLALATAPRPAASGDEEGGRPPAIAFIPDPDAETHWPDGLVRLLSSYLDETTLRYLPAYLPDGIGENLGSIVIDRRGPFSEPGARTYLRSEAREHAVDVLFVLEARAERERTRLVLHGSEAPFDSAWSVAARPARDDRIPETLAALADSAAVRLGASPATDRLVGPADPEAEQAFARGNRFGSIELLDEALRAAGEHEAARSALGFRLFLRMNRERGMILLDETDPKLLGPFLRPVHRARLAWTAGRWDDFESAVDFLLLRFPGRFETLLLEGLGRWFRGEREEAMDRFRDAILVRPFDPLPHRLMAEAALREGFYEAARDEFRRTGALSPGDPLARIGLASVYYSEGLLVEAEEILHPPPPPEPHGVEGNRPHSLHMAALAGFLQAQGRFHEARGYLKEARQTAYRLGDEEGLLDLTIRLFHLNLESGDLDTAATELSEIRFRGRSYIYFERTSPGRVPFLEGLYGAHRLDYGTVTAKRLELETVEGTDSALPDLLEGYYYVMIGSGWDASVPLRRAAKKSESSFLRHLLGRAYTDLGRHGPAVREFEWVVERGESLLDLPPVIPTSFFYLGRAFEARGDLIEASLAYREFLHYWRYASASHPKVTHAEKIVNR